MILSGAGCNESLPPYAKPTAYLSATIHGPDVPAMTYIENHLQENNPARFYALTSGPFPYKIGIQNVYEEVLQADADVDGTLDIWIADNPSIRRTLHLTADNFGGDPKYDYTTGTITIPPGQTLWATVDWDCRFDDSTWVFAYAQFRAYSGCCTRLNAPLELDCRATVRIFRSEAVSTTPVLALPVTMTGKIIWGP